MADTQKRIWMGVAMAAGAAGTFFGVRSFMRWRQQRVNDLQYQQRAVQRMSSRGEDRSSSRDVGNSDIGRRGVGAPVIGTSTQPVAQPDRQSIPTTGAAERENLMNMAVMDSMESSPVSVDNQIGPLSAYLLAFHDLIERLRSRRKESGDLLAQNSLTTDDRGWLEDTLDRLDDQLPDYGEGNLEEGSLQVRIYRLINKTRDAMQSREYTDADLFRINGEVRTEICQLESDIRRAGITEGLERIMQVYECA